MNRVHKGFPWYYESQLVPEDTEMKLMRSLGFNAVRLGHMWAGVAPEEGGGYNATYLDIQIEIIKKFEASGVYVLLDAHEDVLSSKFCLYDGAPRWVVDKSTPRHAFPWPFTGDCASRGWMQNALTEAAGQAYQVSSDDAQTRPP